MIDLSEEQFFGKGADRLCYENPNNANECIKLTIEGRGGAEKRISREIKELKRLEKKSYNTSCASRFLRVAETNLGLGYVFQLIRDFDGSISRTLEDYLKEELSGEIVSSQVCEMLQDLHRICYANHYILSELHPGNMVVQRSGENGKLVIIDGFGNFDFIKLCNWSRGMAQKKLNRKFKGLAKRIGVPFEDITQG